MYVDHLGISAVPKHLVLAPATDPYVTVMLMELPRIK
jgi:hypothetical protein